MKNKKYTIGIFTFYLIFRRLQVNEKILGMLTCFRYWNFQSTSRHWSKWFIILLKFFSYKTIIAKNRLVSSELLCHLNIFIICEYEMFLDLYDSNAVTIYTIKM